jgi:hypothetical protein
MEQISTPSFWTEFSRQAPGIVGTLVIAFMFLRWGVQPFLEYLSSQTTLWQGFLKEQRELSNLALENMTREISELTKMVIEVKTLLQMHDTWERETTRQQKDLLEEITKRQKARKPATDV